MAELKEPCPFCGSGHIRFIGFYGYWSSCPQCKCQGPEVETLDEAIEAWNTWAKDTKIKIEGATEMLRTISKHIPEIDLSENETLSNIVEAAKDMISKCPTEDKEESEVKPETNYSRILNMNEVQLAYFLSWFVKNEETAAIGKAFGVRPTLEWLRQPPRNQ